MAEAANTVGSVEPLVSENTIDWNDTEPAAAASVDVTRTASTNTDSGKNSQLLPIASQFMQRASSWNGKTKMTPPRKNQTQPQRAEEIVGQTDATFAWQDSGDEADGESDVGEAGTRLTFCPLQTIYNEPPDTRDGDTIPLTNVPTPQKTTSPLSSAPLMTVPPGGVITALGSTNSPITNPPALPQDTTNSSTVTLNTIRSDDAPTSMLSTYAPRPPVSTTSKNIESPPPPRPAKRRRTTAEVPMTTNLTGASKEPPSGPNLSASNDNGTRVRTATTDAGSTTRLAQTSLPSTVQSTDFATKTDQGSKPKAAPNPKVEAEAEKTTETETATETSTAKAMRKLEPIDLRSLLLITSAHQSTIPDRRVRTGYLKLDVTQRPLNTDAPPIQDRSKCVLGISAPTSWLPTAEDMAEASREYNDPVEGLQKRKEAELERRLLIAIKEAAKPAPLATDQTLLDIVGVMDKTKQTLKGLMSDCKKVTDSFNWARFPVYNGLRASCANAATCGASYYSLKQEHKRQLASLGLSQVELASFQQALDLHALLVGTSVALAGDVMAMPRDGREPRDPQFDKLPQNVSADRVRRRNQGVQKGLMNGTLKSFTRALDGTELASSRYPRTMWQGVVDLTDRTWASKCETQQYTQGKPKSDELATRDDAQPSSLATGCDPTVVTATDGLPTDLQLTERGKTGSKKDPRKELHDKFAARDGAQLFALMTDCDPTLITATKCLPTDDQLAELGKTFKTRFREVNTEIDKDIYIQHCEGTRFASLVNDGANAYRADLAELRDFHRKHRRFPNGPVVSTVLGSRAVYPADQMGPDNSKYLPRDSSIRTGGNNATFEDPRGEGRVGERLNMLADTLAGTVQDWTTQKLHTEWKPATSLRDALVAGITMSRTRDAYSGASLAGPSKFLRDVSNMTMGNLLRREYDERVQEKKREERRTAYEKLFAAIPETVDETGQDTGQETIQETVHEIAPAPSDDEDGETDVEADEAGVTVEDSDDETAVEWEGSTSSEDSTSAA